MHRAALAFALLLAAPLACAMESSATVYKCALADGGVAYQDYACPGGRLVDIKPDAANPDAVARLERAQSESERANALRRANDEMAQRRAALQRQRHVETPVETADSYVNVPNVFYPLAPSVSPIRDAQRSRSRSAHRPTVRPSHSERRVPAMIRRPLPR